MAACLLWGSRRRFEVISLKPGRCSRIACPPSVLCRTERRSRGGGAGASGERLHPGRVRAVFRAGASAARSGRTSQLRRIRRPRPRRADRSLRRPRPRSLDARDLRVSDHRCQAGRRRHPYRHHRGPQAHLVRQARDRQARPAEDTVGHRLRDRPQMAGIRPLPRRGPGPGRRRPSRGRAPSCPSSRRAAGCRRCSGPACASGAAARTGCRPGRACWPR